jgi:hypothetical protein
MSAFVVFAASKRSLIIGPGTAVVFHPPDAREDDSECFGHDQTPILTSGCYVVLFLIVALIGI